MQTKDKILEFIKQDIKENWDYEEEITESTTLKDEIGMDSLDIIELSIHCESEFRISVDDEDLEGDLTTVGDFVTLITKLL